ncbi:MAG: hypothetical protein RID09_08305 [Coleofasciculus sp. G1-WW12-02]|uniref:hypothetical protein n=1 Tax=Coleofasciculus sp. G1-WW12-02 TaxID=3068483 RepID=UPI0032FB3805
MSNRPPLNASAPASILWQAQQELLPPRQFYRLCQQARQQSDQTQTRLYFYAPDSTFIDLKNRIGAREIRRFLDYLARYVRGTVQEGDRFIFYLKRGRLRLKHKTQTIILIRKVGEYSPHTLFKQAMKIEVKIAGAGMIGRVACLRINGKDFAFKAFFDPDFVWQHGPWAEIPIGIRLKYCQVTKDMPEFLFSGLDWAIWEWIYPHTHPQSRKQGITYQQFAQREGLTTLNPLNRNNYNPHNIRLDPGGIQKNYWGRRLQDFFRSLMFYARKVRTQGWKSLTPYLKPEKLRYLGVRLVSLRRTGGSPRAVLSIIDWHTVLTKKTNVKHREL